MKYFFLIFLLSQMAGASVPSQNQDSLRAIAFSPEANMNERWRAFMSLVKMKDKKSMPEIHEALKSSDWFMRDAALKAIIVVNKEEALKAARYVLKNDKSLIVRTSAVEVLRLLSDRSVAQDLWTAFYDEKNFRKKQSLWIRPKIMSALIEIEDKNISNYRLALKDKDLKIQKMAKFALDKFSN